MILAGVTIATLTGNEGILTKTTKAEDETKKAESIEEVQLAVLASYDKDDTFNYEELNKNLSKISGLIYNDGLISGDNKIEKLPAIVKINGYDIKINANGTITEATKTKFYFNNRRTRTLL